MNYCCENCGWSEIVGPPTIRCNYNGHRTWCDECCEAWKPKEEEIDMVEVVRCKDCKWYDKKISMCDNCGLPREQTFSALTEGGETGMNEKEALIRIKTGNFNNGYGFDMQLLVDAVGTIEEMFRSGQISEVVRCKDCKHYDGKDCTLQKWDWWPVSSNWFCADGERQ